MSFTSTVMRFEALSEGFEILGRNNRVRVDTKPPDDKL